MDIALYGNHHHLPFWHRPQLPVAVFNGTMEDYRTLLPGQDIPLNSHPFRDDAMWPCLQALHTLMSSSLMAHVSLGIDIEHRIFWYPYRLWIQITTVTERVSEDGLPFTVVGGKPLVDLVWGLDNGTRNPFQLPGAPSFCKSTLEAWRQFFISRLDEVRVEREEDIARHRARIAVAEDILRAIGSVPEQMVG